MKTIRLCANCLQPLPENAPEGLCPQCLAKAAFETEPAERNPDNPPSPAQLAPFFPQLEIIELLGQGGMGLVYKARQPHLDRLVALKVLPVDSAARPGFPDRFNREARALARLNHPGIVTVYDFGQAGQYYYFVMEFVDGMNLRGLLQSHPVEPRQALELVVQICTSLQYAHDKGVVHRDIKPENILISKEGQVKIADFGLAKLLGVAPDSSLTMSKEAMGTLNYMAPEQRQDAQKVDHRADIYSLGVVFYEMLTGEVPMGRFEPPSKKVQVDVRLDEVVLKALEREPARRYQQVKEVKTGIETITSTMPREMSAAKAPEPFKPHPQEEVLWTRLAISGYEIKVGVATLVLLGFMTWGAVLCFRNHAYGSATTVIMAELGIFISVGQMVYARRAERRAREKGLWPQFGQIPTVEHVKRLAQSGQKSLAVKLYRRICPLSLRDAREVVRGLALGASSVSSEHEKAAPQVPPSFYYSDLIAVVILLLALFANYFLAQLVPALGLMLFCAIMLVATFKLSSRLKIERAREKGLWPPAPALAPAIRQPTLARHVVIPMLVLSLLWLALFLFAPKTPFFRSLVSISGVTLLAVGLPTALFDWRRKLAGQGLRWKDLPQATQRRNISPIIAAAIPCAILLIAATAFAPSRERTWREDYFLPKSHAYEKLGLDGHITGYHFPFWSQRAFAGFGTIAIKIYSSSPTPAALTVSLPGLQLPEPADPGKPPQALTLSVLTNWLHERARLDLAQPQVQVEAAQLMNLFEPYYLTAPGSWEEFFERAKAQLRSFDFSATQSNMWEGGGIPVLINGLPIYIGVCLCLFYFLTLRSLRRAFAEARSEIAAGTWMPPKPGPMPAARDVPAPSTSSLPAASKPPGGVKSNETITVPQPGPAATLAPSQPRLSRTALGGAACLILLIGVVGFFMVFDLDKPPLNHHESFPSVVDAQGRVISTQDIEVSGPGTWWRVAGLVSIVLGTAAALGATTCGWVAVTQIQRSSGALYGLGLALFDAQILPLLLLNFLLLGHGLVPTLLCLVLDYFIIRNVYRHYREPAPKALNKVSP